MLSWLTGGEDGVNFSVPSLLHSRLASYYLVFTGAFVLFLGLLRIVNSPFGRVLLSIRENEFRAEALGTRTVISPGEPNSAATACSRGAAAPRLATPNRASGSPSSLKLSATR